jgi:hypothetical protein
MLTCPCETDYEHCGIGATRVGRSAVCRALRRHASFFRAKVPTAFLSGGNNGLLLLQGRSRRNSGGPRVEDKTTSTANCICNF